MADKKKEVTIPVINDHFFAKKNIFIYVLGDDVSKSNILPDLPVDGSGKLRMSFPTNPTELRIGWTENNLNRYATLSTDKALLPFVDSNVAVAFGADNPLANPPNGEIAYWGPSLIIKVHEKNMEDV